MSEDLLWRWGHAVTWRICRDVAAKHKARMDTIDQERAEQLRPIPANRLEGNPWMTEVRDFNIGHLDREREQMRLCWLAAGDDIRAVRNWLQLTAPELAARVPPFDHSTTDDWCERHAQTMREIAAEVAKQRMVNPPPPETGPVGINHLGEGRFEARDGTIIHLEDSESAVVVTLLKRGAASKDQLIQWSEIDDAPRVLRRMVVGTKAKPAKYPCLAADIQLPGRRGNGGYRATKRPAPQSATIG